VDFIPFGVEQIEYFLLIFVRIVTIIALLPVFGSQQIPLQIKIGLSLLLSVILFSCIMENSTPLQDQFSLTVFALLVIKEVMVGLIMGFVSSFLFTAVQFAGRMVDTEMGFGFVELADPFTDEPTTVLGQLQVILFTILFLLINGHYFFMIAVQRSFEIVPLTNIHFSEGRLAVQITTLIGNIFIVALKFAAPVYVTLFLTELALGVVARTVPQINIFFVGMPLKIAIGLGTTILVLPMLASLFKNVVEVLIQDIWRILFLMA